MLRVAIGNEPKVVLEYKVYSNIMKELHKPNPTKQEILEYFEDKKKYEEHKKLYLRIFRQWCVDEVKMTSLAAIDILKIFEHYFSLLSYKKYFRCLNDKEKMVIRDLVIDQLIEIGSKDYEYYSKTRIKSKTEETYAERILSKYDNTELFGTTTQIKFKGLTPELEFIRMVNENRTIIEILATFFKT